MLAHLEKKRFVLQFWKGTGLTKQDKKKNTDREVLSMEEFLAFFWGIQHFHEN